MCGPYKAVFIEISLFLIFSLYPRLIRLSPR